MWRTLRSARRRAKRGLGMTIVGGLWAYFFDPQLGAGRRSNLRRWMHELPGVGRRMLERATQRPPVPVAGAHAAPVNDPAHHYADLGEPVGAGPRSRSVV